MPTRLDDFSSSSASTRLNSFRSCKINTGTDEEYKWIHPCERHRMSCPYLDGKVYEATNVEGVLHEVKDELNVRNERQEIGHP